MDDIDLFSFSDAALMARIRSQHPGQWSDEDFVLLTPWARLLTLAIRNEADDNGVFEWKPTTIKMRLFPADNVQIDPLLEEMVAHNQIKKFSACGRHYGVIRNFRRFQRPKKPNSIHPFPNEFRTYVGLGDENTEPEDDDDGGGSENSPQRKEEGDKMKEEGDSSPSESQGLGARVLPLPGNLDNDKKNAELLFLAAWNVMAQETGLARCQKFTTQRRGKFRAREKDAGGLSGVLQGLEKLKSSPFLCGDNDRGWKADIDFFLRESSFTKLMEGAYDRKKSNGNGSSQTGPNDGIARAAIFDALAPNVGTSSR